MITQYSNFIEDLLLEKAINESVIYFSPKIRGLIASIDNPISDDLLKINGDEIKPDITFVDIDDSQEGFISFITMANAWNRIKQTAPECEYIINAENPNISKRDRVGLADSIYNHPDYQKVYSQSRNPLKIGKFVNKIFPDKYTAAEMEKFTNQFKTLVANKKERFLLVEGDDIAKWYNGSMYASGGGTLNNSCMRNKTAEMFYIYTNNTEYCKMLILVEEGKLLGRALVWKAMFDNNAIPDDTYFMDRVYTAKDSDLNKFIDYAKKQGWVHKKQNNYNSHRYVIYNNVEYNIGATVQLNKYKDNYHYELYPYMDTFRRYDPQRGTLYNDCADHDSNSYSGQYLLADTGGGFEEIESGVWSEWHNQNIDEDEAVWSDWADSYLYRDEAVEISRGRDGTDWYPTDGCDDITYDEWSDEYIHMDDAHYSDYYDYYIKSDSAVECIIDISSDGQPTISDGLHEDYNLITSVSVCKRTDWYNKLSEDFPDWNTDYILKELLVKNYKNEYILKEFEIKEYQVVDQDNLYLVKIDAFILGYKIKATEHRITDEFGYNKSIEKLLQEIVNLGREQISKLEKKVQKNKEKGIDNTKISNKITDIKDRIIEIESNTYIDLD